MSVAPSSVRLRRLARAAMFAAAALSVVAIVTSSVLAMSGSSRPSGHGPASEGMSAETRQAYDLASTHGDLFVHLPCYCGCVALPEPHRSLRDCFIDASGAPEAHAASCSICVDIALAAWAALDRGLDHAQIRALVDEQFSARGPATQTPYP